MENLKFKLKSYAMKTSMIKKILIVFCIIVLMGTRTFAQTMLYHTDFSPSQTTLSAPYIMHAGTGAYQPISGIDVATGQQGPMIPMGASISFMDMIAGDPVTLSTLGNYITNTIEQIPGPDGSTVYALNQNIIQNFAPQGKSTQDALMIYGSGGLTNADVYYTYWFKLPSDVHTQLGIIDGIDNWRVMSEWKTGGSTDYRVITHIKQDNNKNLYWYNEGAGWDSGGTKHIYWTFNNTYVPVPVGTWFKYEVFWHRSTPGSTNGRYWAAINGQVIVDHSGPLYPTIDGTEYGQVIADPQLIDRIFLNNAYSGGGSPVQQWVTDLEIWDGWPCGAGVSCYNAGGGDGPAGYTKSCDEGGTVNVTGTMDIAFGANGQFNYLYNQTANCGCNATAFGGDPIQGVFKACYTKTSGDTQQPTVSLTEPADGATVSGSSVAVSATASDNIGVVGVQFKLDGANLGTEVTTSPYSITWNTTATANGSHTLTAVAHDAAGNTTTSTARTVTVSNGGDGPAGYDYSCAEYGTVSVTGTMDIAFGANGSYFYLYNQTANCGCNATVFGGDPIQGVEKYCYTKTSGDTQQPTVSLTAPADGATVSGSSVAVSATASDNVGVVGVQFKLDGANLGTEVTTSPYSITWNTTATANGSHTLTAVAHDAAGNTTTSTARTVTVSATLTTSTTLVAPGAALTATVTNGPGIVADWVGFYPVGVAMEYSVAYKHMNDTTTFPATGITNATLHFTAVDTNGAPATPGQYNFRLYNGSSFALVATSATITVVADTQPPTVPTGLASSSKTETSFTLSWATSIDNVGVTGYEVFRNGTSIGTTTTTSMSVTGLSAGITYSMTVRARDAVPNWSLPSTALPVTTSDTHAPSVPAGLTSGSITQTSFTLSWATSTDNVGVTGYEVFRDGTSIGTTTTTSMSVTGLSAGITYGMTVRARDVVPNWSAQSNPPYNVTTTSDGPAGYTYSCNEYGTVTVTGTKNIAFGANGSYLYLYNQTANCGCNATVFGGDPIVGVEKYCYTKTPSTNLAASGIASRWSKNTTATANTNKVAAAGLNDGNIATDVLLNNGTNESANRYEAAGVVWSSAKTIGSVYFTNGSWSSGKGSFTAALTLQFSTNGTTWTNASGWTVAPAYSYNASNAGITFMFSGTAVTGVLGMRIVGQCYTGSIGSREARIREVEAYAESLKSALIIDGLTSVPEIVNTDFLSLYPNPATTILMVELSAIQDNEKIQIYNTLGELVKELNVSALKLQVNIEDLPGGIYIVRISNSPNLSRKFIKQ